MTSAPDPVHANGDDRAAKHDARLAAQVLRAAAWEHWHQRGTHAAADALAAHARQLLEQASHRIGTSPRCASGYLPIRTEIDPLPLLSAMANASLQTGLPVVIARDKPLLFRRWQPGSPTVSAQFGTREPPPENPLVEPDLLLVPLLAFDRHGFRLGYGGGYYDRTLSGLRTSSKEQLPIFAVGLAFDAQEVDAVPHLDYDQRLDAILTPSRLRSVRE